MTGRRPRRGARPDAPAWARMHGANGTEWTVHSGITFCCTNRGQHPRTVLGRYVRATNPHHPERRQIVTPGHDVEVHFDADGIPFTLPDPRPTHQAPLVARARPTTQHSRAYRFRCPRCDRDVLLSPPRFVGLFAALADGDYTTTRDVSFPL